METDDEVLTRGMFSDHDIIYKYRNHIIISCGDCKRTHVVPSFKETQDAQKWIYGRFLAEKCETEDTKTPYEKAKELSDYK